jgi:hypothetical protein
MIPRNGDLNAFFILLFLIFVFFRVIFLISPGGHILLLPGYKYKLHG